MRVQVPPRADHSERREAKLHEDDRVRGGNMDRSCEPTGKDRIQGAVKQGE